MKRDTPDILKEIVAVKRREVERLKVETPVPDLEARIERRNPPLNFGGALMGASVRIIAEVKKASPAKGLLRAGFDPVDLATAYVENGAAAISVLTNAGHFQGSIDHLAAVHSVANPKGVPVLRKEFIFDPYQVHEARAYGADAILLIVAMLTPRTWPTSRRWPGGTGCSALSRCTTRRSSASPWTPGPRSWASTTATCAPSRRAST